MTVFVLERKLLVAKTTAVSSQPLLKPCGLQDYIWLLLHHVCFMLSKFNSVRRRYKDYLARHQSHILTIGALYPRCVLYEEQCVLKTFIDYLMCVTAAALLLSPLDAATRGQCDDIKQQAVTLWFTGMLPSRLSGRQGQPHRAFKNELISHSLSLPLSHRPVSLSTEESGSVKESLHRMPIFTISWEQEYQAAHIL